MKKYLIVAVAVCSLGCYKQVPPRPADAVMKLFDALNTQDSAGLSAVSAPYRPDIYPSSTGKHRITLEEWKDRHSDIEILSDARTGNEATVVLNETITGRNPQSLDSVRIHTYKIGGQWKYGYNEN